MSKQNRDGFIAFVEHLKSAFGTLNDDQLGRLRQKARLNYGLPAQETEQILEDLGLKVINYFEVLGLTIKELENHSEETVKKRVEDAWLPRYKRAVDDTGDGAVERRDILNNAKNMLIDPQKRQIHIAQIKSISAPDPIIKFRTGETATSVGELVSLMEQHSGESVAALYRNEITQGLDQFGEKHFADVARAVVRQFSVDQRTGFMALIAVLRGKIRLENGCEAGTPQELARLIDQNWEQSQKLLYNGLIAFWLEHTKQSQIARTAKDITNRYRSKQDIGLEEFVQKLDPQIGKPKLQVNPSQIDFGQMDMESQKAVDIQITNAGRGYLYGDVWVPTDMPGLQVLDTEIQGGAVISVKLDPSLLTPNKTYQIALVFKTNGGMIRVLVSCNIILNVNTKNEYGETPLHIAAAENDCERVGALIDSGADVNEKNLDGDSPLHHAALENASETAEVLLKNGAEVNAKDRKDRTPLHRAASKNASETTEVLLRHGAEINGQNKYGNTPLHHAAWNNSSETVEVLLRYGADVNVKDKYGKTSLHIAKETKMDNMIALLHKAEWKEHLQERVGEVRDTDNGNDEKDPSAQKRARTSRINVKDAHGNTPLHRAARNGDYKQTQVLLEEGADVNAENKKGNRPLHLAAEHNADTVMEVLLKNGADVNAKNKHLDTPLHSAAYYNADKAIRVLLKNGADVNATTYAATTPLHDTAHRDAAKAAEVLLKNGADVEGRRDADKWSRRTPLHKAALYNAHKTAEVLLRNGADVNAKNSSGETPLRVAVDNSADEVVEVLRRYGAKKGIFW